MADMQGRYGEKKGKQVFYATANKAKGSGLAGVLAAHKRAGKLKKGKTKP